MSKYVYNNPLDDGYKKFKLTKQQHNKLFKYRQINSDCVFKGNKIYDEIMEIIQK